MNLRKALDRAKQERSACGNGSEARVAGETGELEAETAALVYSESRTVRIDMPTALRNHCVALSSDFAEVNYYKVLRTQLRQISQQRGWNAVMVTSTNPGEGKTVTSINLAAMFAREFNQTALLVDADLRMQMVHRYLGYDSPLGLLDCLEGKATLADVIAWPEIDQLTLISGDRVVDDSAELIGSPRMKALVEELKHRYDDRFILFDAPPILGEADALAFAPLVDGILVVVGDSTTTRKDLKKALEMLPQEKIIGFALNRFNIPKHHYGSYGYRYEKQAG
jgi:non-specific protein-tyrosine kinase